MARVFGTLAHTDVPVAFAPQLAPMSRGILLTAIAPLKKALTPRGCARGVRRAYRERGVRALAAGRRVAGDAARQGSNRCDVAVTTVHGGKTLLATSAIDNLVKGAAGQAIQNLNLVLGLARRLGPAGARESLVSELASRTSPAPARRCSVKLAVARSKPRARSRVRRCAARVAASPHRRWSSTAAARGERRGASGGRHAAFRDGLRVTDAATLEIAAAGARRPREQAARRRAARARRGRRGRSRCWTAASSARAGMRTPALLGEVGEVAAWTRRCSRRCSPPAACPCWRRLATTATARS
jgi:hypothetical protein